MCLSHGIVDKDNEMQVRAQEQPMLGSFHSHFAVKSVPDPVLC